MKTNTYLRWSLLIPLLVWGLSILIFAVGGSLSRNLSVEDESPLVLYAILLPVMFYVFGIIVWIFPYTLLALILFFWSFLAQARLALRVFALSPLAMTVLTAAALNIFMLGDLASNAPFSNPGVIDRDLISLNLLGAAFTLIWGYICVGIGFGIYRYLQNRGLIKAETQLESAAQAI